MSCDGENFLFDDMDWNILKEFEWTFGIFGLGIRKEFL